MSVAARTARICTAAFRMIMLAWLRCLQSPPDAPLLGKLGIASSSGGYKQNKILHNQKTPASTISEVMGIAFIRAILNFFWGRREWEGVPNPGREGRRVGDAQRQKVTWSVTSHGRRPVNILGQYIESLSI